MKAELIQQLRAWNPWWEAGIEGLRRYEIPAFKRELYDEVKAQFEKGKQIVSIVGMRQIGKSTLMRQIIQGLLEKGANPKHILYVSFDDPFLNAENLSEENELFERVIQSYTEHILKKSLSDLDQTIYFFFDEAHVLNEWDKKLKAFYDRAYPIRYLVSGSSSLRIQKKNRESLLGRISEFTLWPFSFREFVSFRTHDNQRMRYILSAGKKLNQSFLKTFTIELLFDELKEIYQEANIWEKQSIIQELKHYMIVGGFPRAWEANLDFASRQRVLWEQHIVKVLFEDLIQIAKIHKPKELAFLFMQIVQWNGKEFVMKDLQNRLGIHWNTLQKYLNYLIQTFLVFRVDKTKSKRFEIKRRSGHVKFYVSDVAFQNALHKRDESIYEDSDAMGLIAENLVCSLVQRWITGTYREDLIQYYRDSSGEVDFLAKQLDTVLPVEVKYRKQISNPKSLSNLVKKWKLQESILVTKDGDLSYKNGRLSIPLWFFLLMF